MLWLLVVAALGVAADDAVSPPPPEREIEPALEREPDFDADAERDARAVTHVYSAYGTYKYFNDPDGHYQSYYTAPPTYGVPPPTPYPYVPPTQIDYPYWTNGPLPPAPPTPAVGGAPPYLYDNYLYYGAGQPTYAPPPSSPSSYYQIDPPTGAPTLPPATVGATAPPTSPPLVTAVPCAPLNLTCWRALNASLAENGHVVGAIALGTIAVVTATLLLVAYVVARALTPTVYLLVDNGGMGDVFREADNDFRASSASAARAAVTTHYAFELPQPPRFVSMDAQTDYARAQASMLDVTTSAARPWSGARWSDIWSSRRRAPDLNVYNV